MSKPSKKAKSISKLLAEHQKEVNAYVRQRDTDWRGQARCISCGETITGSQIQAGHFHPTTHKAIRFNLKNINAQCVRCNCFLHGNGSGYALGIVRKYGPGVLEELDRLDIKDFVWTRLLLKRQVVSFREMVEKERCISLKR